MLTELWAMHKVNNNTVKHIFATFLANVLLIMRQEVLDGSHILGSLKNYLVYAPYDSLGLFTTVGYKSQIWSFPLANKYMFARNPAMCSGLEQCETNPIQTLPLVREV